MSKSGEIRGSSLARNTLLNLIGQFVPLVIGFITIPFIIRGLGTERFGILALAWAVVAYVSLFNLGLGRATIKFVSELLGKGEDEKIPSLVWTSLFFNFLLCTAGGIALAIATPFLIEHIFNIPSVLVREARATFLILAASVPVMTSVTTLRGALEGCQRFDLVNAVKAPSNSLIFLIPALGVPLGLRLPGIVFCLLIAQLVTAFVYLMLCFKVIPILKKVVSIEKKVVRSLFSFGGWVTVSNVVHPVIVYLDRFLIGSLLTIEAVAFYTAPHEMATRFWVLPASLVMTMFPVFSSLGVRRDEELGSLYAKSVKYLLLIMGVLILIMVLFAKEILQLWLGADFAQKCTLVLQILAVGVLINSLSFIPFSLIQGIGRPDITAKFHLLEVPIFVVFAWLLIRKFGIDGAALAWSLRVGLDAVLLFGASWKLVPSTLPALRQNGIIKAVFTFSGLTLMAILSIILNKVLLIKILILVALITVFCVVVWKYVLDPTDRKSFASMLSLVSRGAK